MRRLRSTFLMTATALLVGCTNQASAVLPTPKDVPAATWTQLPSADQLESRVLTVGSGTGDYQVAKSGDQLTVRAAGQAENQRQVFWPVGQPAMRDAQVCATWTSATADSSQEGLALRIVAEPGRTRALTVTKNVFAGAYWTINVHTWDTSRGTPFEQIGQVELGPVVWDYAANKPLPLPWRVCARVVDQALLLIVWRPGVEPQPRWDDKSHGLTIPLPVEYTAPGQAGWYAGHLEPGGSVAYGELGVWRYTG